MLLGRPIKDIGLHNAWKSLSTSTASQIRAYSSVQPVSNEARCGRFRGVKQAGVLAYRGYGPGDGKATLPTTAATAGMDACLVGGGRETVPDACRRRAGTPALPGRRQPQSKPGVEAPRGLTWTRKGRRLLRGGRNLAALRRFHAALSSGRMRRCARLAKVRSWISRLSLRF